MAVPQISQMSRRQLHYCDASRNDQRRLCSTETGRFICAKTERCLAGAQRFCSDSLPPASSPRAKQIRLPVLFSHNNTDYLSAPSVFASVCHGNTEALAGVEAERRSHPKAAVRFQMRDAPLSRSPTDGHAQRVHEHTGFRCVKLT